MKSLHRDMAWHRPLGRLIDQLDQDTFWQTLIDLLKKYIPVDNWVALIFSNKPPYLLEFSRPSDNDNPGPLIESYLSGLYLLDPFYIANRQSPKSGFFHLADIAPEHFLETEYYTLYFAHYISVDEVQYNVKLDNDRTLCLSIGSKQRFCPEHIALFELIQPWVIAAMHQRMFFEGSKIENSHHSPSRKNILEEAMHQLDNPLTTRELDVVRLVLSGFSNKEIADNLSLSPETIKVHRRHIYKKLNIKSQTELFAFFFKSPNG